MRKPAAFLDRDGVINVDHGHVGEVHRLEYIPKALESVAYLNQLGFFVFIVTNQAGIAKGKYTVEAYNTVMAKIFYDLEKCNGHIDDVRFCPYHDDAIEEQYRYHNHPWRKPNPGMITNLIETWNVDVTNSFLVGDKQTDLRAAEHAGIPGFLFDGNVDLETFIKSIPNVQKLKLSLTKQII